MPRTPQAYSTASQAPMLQRVWTSMRVMRRFTRGELMTTAEAGQRTVEGYVRALRDAGYLRLARGRVNGPPRSTDTWAPAPDRRPPAPPRPPGRPRRAPPNTQQTWGPAGALLRDERPTVAGRLTLAQREALRLALAHDGAVKASFEALAGLARAGLVHLQVPLTDAGGALAAELQPPLSQRHAQLAAAGEAHE